MSKLARSELAMLAYEASSVAQMKSTIDKSVASNIGYVYVTDRTLNSNPWDGLPSYFEQEVDYIATI